MRSLALLASLLLFSLACSDGGDGGGGACRSVADCASDEQCIDEVCVPRTDAGALDAGSDAGSDAGQDAGPDTLIITPTDPTIAATGSEATLALHALLNGATEPEDVIWLIDDVTLGTISADGVFTANGLVAGEVLVTARYGPLEATTTLRVTVDVSQSFVDGLADDVASSLRGTGVEDSAFRWLYPYDGTVFPRGLGAPVLQSAGDGEVLRVTLDVESTGFHYEGFFPGGAPLQVNLPQEIWEGATRSAGAYDALVVGMSKTSAGVVAGPITESLRIAQGELTGSVYYNSYNSPLAGGSGAILRVGFGETAEVVQAGCTVCHSVSANGSRIATGLSWSGTATITGTGNPVQSGTIDIAADGTSAAAWTDPDGRRYSFGALTPDGSRVLSSAVAPGNQIRGLSGTMPSRLYDALTGAEIAAPTFSDQVAYAVTPQFAPDASALAFSWYRETAEDGRALAVMSHDDSSDPPVFGTPRVVVTHDSLRLGWPSFTPDAQAVVYQEGQYFDTSRGGGTGNANLPSYADLRLVDLTSCDEAGASCAVSNLEALNGYGGDGSFYLPYGEAEEASSNYEPTILPVAVGGYYWVVFTSRRAYGNTLAPGGSVAGSEDRWGYNNGSGEIPSVRKKLWVAAIDLSGEPGSDRSHPAFYLEGQELAAGNMRGFVALDPCRAEGEGCDSAAECCGGFCRDVSDGSGAPVLQCVPRPDGCSEELEACTTDADCCGALDGYQCINEHCSQPPLI